MDFYFLLEINSVNLNEVSSKFRIFQVLIHSKGNICININLKSQKRKIRQIFFQKGNKDFNTHFSNISHSIQFNHRLIDFIFVDFDY